MKLTGQEFIEFLISEEEKENQKLVESINLCLEERARKTQNLRSECIRNKFDKMVHVTLPAVIDQYRVFRE